MKKFLKTKEELRNLIEKNSKKLEKNEYKEFCKSFNDKYDYSSITDMSNLFNNVTGIETIPKLKLSNVKSINNMFYNCKDLKYIDDLDVLNFNDVSNMFSGCENLETLSNDFLDSFKYVEKAENVFRNCKKLKITNVNFFSCKNLKSAFYGCENLEKINVVTPNCENFKKLFKNCTNLKESNIIINSDIDIDLEEIHFNNEKLEKTFTLPYKNKVFNMKNMFKNCSKLNTSILLEINGLDNQNENIKMYDIYIKNVKVTTENLKKERIEKIEKRNVKKYNNYDFTNN